MSRFHYTARGPNGQVQGTQEAASAAALAGDLRARGWVPLTIREDVLQAAKAAQAVNAPAWMAPKVTQTDVMLLSKQIHTLFKAGVPILRALAGLQETATNPTLRIYDLSAVAQTARARGVLTVVDNTFATPCLTRPLEHGIDLVLHSATKYLGGHGDALAGVLAGPKALLDAVRAEGLRHLGGTLGAFEGYLMLRGLKTLPLRMEAHCTGAAKVAEYLSGHPAVRRVYYPGLPSHPGHEVARRQMQGFGGLVSIELASKQAAAMFLDALKLFTQAVSLGDVESLATHLGHNGWIIAGFTPVVAESEAECHSCHHTYPPGTTLYRPVFTRGRAQNALQEIPKEVWLECGECVSEDLRP